MLETKYSRMDIARAALEAGFSLSTFTGQGRRKLMPMTDIETLTAFLDKLAAQTTKQDK